MKGFVLSIRKVKNEDSIALILTASSVKVYYRFFGARHSILQLGYLIDFEVEGENSTFLPRLRSLSHMGFPWLFDKNRLLVWHQFIQKFEVHLKDATEVDSFYYQLLLDAARKWNHQNPKRIVCESYMALLHYEGRLSMEDTCFICEAPIEEEIALMQAFKVAHPSCIYAPALPAKKIFDALSSKKSIFLEDYEVEYLFDVVMKGF